MTAPNSAREAELSPEAQAYQDKLFRCEPPCDKFGICTPCMEAVIFRAGYNFGARHGFARALALLMGDEAAEHRRKGLSTGAPNAWAAWLEKEAGK